MELHELKEALIQVDPHNTQQIVMAMYQRSFIDPPSSTLAWRKLFAFYNSTGRRIGMGCRGCYKSVYDFVEAYVQKETLKNA
jgi:hypothetical protein